MRGFHPPRKNFNELALIIDKIRKVELVLGLRKIDLQKVLESDYWTADDLQEVSKAINDLEFFLTDSESKEALEGLKRKVTGS